MKKRTIYILSIMLIIISVADCIKAQNLGSSPGSPIEIGTKNAGFQFSDTKDTQIYNSNAFLYGGSGIVFYNLTITKPMDITISHCGSELSDTYIRLLKGRSYNDKIAVSNSSSNECSNKKRQAYLKVVGLEPGEYTIASYGEGHNRNGNITTTIEGYASIEYDLGVISGSAYYSHYQDTRLSLNEYGYRPTKDVFYKFTTTKGMKIKIGSSMNSSSGSCVCLVNSSKTSRITYNCSPQNNPNKEYAEVNVLPSGTYYVVSEGGMEDGYINTWIELTDMLECNLGEKSSSFEYTETRSTIHPLFTGSTDGIFYRINIREKMDLRLTNSTAFSSGSCISLLNSSKTSIATKCFPKGNPSNESLVVKDIEPGIYYVVSKGKSEEGSITTNIIGYVLAEYDLGTQNSLFDYYHTQNTDKSRNEWNNKPTNDAVYKINIANNGLQLRVSNSMTSSAGSCISIWNADKKTLLATKCFSKDNQANENIQLGNLEIGTYYIFSEGQSENGIINTYISLIMYGESNYRNKNYIKTRTYIGEGANNYLDAIQYFDGLGRPMQNIQQSVTPSGYDLATYQEYDIYGRDSIALLPSVIRNNNGDFAPPPKVMTNAAAIYADSKPFSYPVYENSPLNRILEQYSPGQDWHNNRKSAKMKYLTNGKGSIPTSKLELYSKDTLSGVYAACDQIILKPGFLFKATAEKSLILKVDPNQCAQSKSLLGKGVENIKPVFLTCDLYKASNDKLSRKGTYADGELYITEIKDEDGNTSYEFQDKFGRIILTRVINGTEKYDTYYVYDDFGNLCYVLPPMAVDKLTDYSDNNVIMQQYAYIYKYNARKLCIKKRLPGTDWIYYVYDKADRMIFAQDGEQRLKKEWTFTIPDVFGRIILVGVCKNNISDIETYLKDVIVKGESPKAADKANSYTGSYNGYNIVGVGLSDWKLLSANYYDSYDFFKIAGFNNTNLKYVANAAYGARHGDEKAENKYQHKGLLTASMTATMGANGVDLHTVMYYDYKKQVIQSRSTNHTGGYDHAYTAYSFIGQPTKMLTEQTVNNKKTTELYVYIYDRAGRLTETTHQLNGGTTISLAKKEYDELGRLKSNVKNNQSKLKTAYAYNTRSWTKSISGDLFKQTLYYNESYGGSKPSYTGNISAMNWTLLQEKTRGYVFTYDNLSRLTAANYLVNEVNSTDYKTSYTYDKHGNMTTLERWGKTTSAEAFGIIDKLTMGHTGNQMIKAIDGGVNVNIAESSDFKDHSKGKGQYTYNANGAMNKDTHKGISEIQYNSLNLPQRMDIKSPVAEARNEYTYSAGGQKLKVVQQWNSGFNNNPVVGSTINVAALDQIKTTDYVSNKIYENSSLKRILIDGGYIENNIYHFYITDHLGNNRVVAKADGTVVQRNHYYPFGMSFAETSATEQGLQPYKYNDKEFDQTHGLNLYDYIARNMDPVVPRFTSVDPHAENYYSWSPYAYVGNNPIKRIDPTGMDWYIFDEKTGRYDEKKKKDGEHRMVVKSVEKNRNIKYTFHDFNDPKSDAQSIENEKINQFEYFSDQIVGKIMDKSGVRDQSVSSRWEYAINESNANNLSGSGKMDFRVYPEIGNANSLFVRNGYAYNAADAGNFLWGYAMRIMGFSETAAKTAAHVDAWRSAKESNDEGSQNPNQVKRWFENRSWLGDSKEDQRAIKRGMIDAGSYWQYKIKTMKKLWK